MKEGSETKLGEDYKGGSAHIDGGEKMEGGAFDGARAAELTAELRRSFDSGRTRSYEWRAAQLKGIARMIEEKEADIMAALHDDLAKPQMESFLHEDINSATFLY